MMSFSAACWARPCGPGLQTQGLLGGKRSPVAPVFGPRLYLLLEGFPRHYAVAALRFGAVEGGVDGVQDFLDSCAVLWENGYADRQRQGSEGQAAVLYVQVFELFPQLLGALLRNLDRGFRQNQDKLLAPITARDVFTPGAGSQESSQLPQQRVAGRMTIRVIEDLEFVQVEHDGSQPALVAGRPPQLAYQRFFHVPPVEQPCEGISNRLHAQGLAQPQIGQGQGNVPGGGDRQTLLGIGQAIVPFPRDRSTVHVQHAQRLALPHHRHAQVAHATQRTQMPADQAQARIPHQVHLPAPQRPAVLGSEHALTQQRLTPDGHCFDQVLRGIQNAQRARLAGEELLRRARNDGVGFFGANAGLQQINHLVEQSGLLGALLERPQPAPEHGVALLKRFLGTPALGNVLINETPSNFPFTNTGTPQISTSTAVPSLRHLRPVVCRTWPDKTLELTSIVSVPVT